MFLKILDKKQKFNLKNLNGILKNWLALRLQGKMNLNLSKPYLQTFWTSWKNLFLVSQNLKTQLEEQRPNLIALLHKQTNYIPQFCFKILNAVCLGFVHTTNIGSIPFQIVLCETHIEAQSCKALYLTWKKIYISQFVWQTNLECGARSNDTMKSRYFDTFLHFLGLSSHFLHFCVFSVTFC